MIKLNTFPAIKAPKIAEQLYSLGDLCHVTSTLIKLCPDLHVLDFAVGLTDLVRKLPQHLQHRWEMVQIFYLVFELHPYIHTHFDPCPSSAYELSRPLYKASSLFCTFFRSA